ncbi:hypothetical protein K431DRAFT_349921 [Polychaeton citri CBS 116435]|uniref:F-box domain-containing protein n=1 Tax=Polychaeton citri CBS 116435 TaxID=1314669 RepID=A0A9P4Q2N3_9PEZI|nr:hypothetical protein K431DRAFT_349921 [Polychaeton citri CBS 116435]
MVFSKLRRTSEQIISRTKSSSSSIGLRSNSTASTSVANNNQIGDPGINNTNDESRPSFLDLPPELRNAIYELVAANTSLFVPPTQQQSPSSKSQAQQQYLPIPSLLLTSNQILREYRPILLSRARITFRTSPTFDFRNLTRLISSLYATELKALRSNPRLSITFLLPLSARPLTPQALTSLRRWLENRSQNLDRIPFGYAIKWTTEEVKFKASGTAPTTERRVEAVKTYLEGLSRLHWNVDEGLQWELDRVIACFEAELGALEALGRKAAEWSGRGSMRGVVGRIMT